MKKILGLFVLILLVSTNAYSALTINSVSGNISEGNSISINVTDSGTGDSSPIIWDNFDSGTIGNQLSANPLIGAWDVGSSGLTVYNTIGGSRSGTQSAYTPPHIYAGRNNISTTGSLESIDKFYWSFWFKHSGAPNSIIKVIQLWGNRYSGVNCDYAPGLFSGGAGGAWSTYNAPADNDCLTGREQDYFSTVPAENVWHHIEIVAQRSTDGVADGTYIVKVDGVAEYNYDGNIMTRNGTGQAWLEAIFFYGMLGSGGLNVTQWIDDAYFNDSWSRVVVGNNSTFSLCTEFDIWPVSNWPTGGTVNLTATVNQGSYSNGQTAYLFVIDSDNNVSPSYSITFAASTAPSVSLPADFSATSPTSYQGTATATTGRTITGVVSSNGYTVTPDDGVWDEQVEAFTVTGVIPTVTDTCTATDSSAETGQDSITITLTVNTPVAIDPTGTAVTIDPTGTPVTISN